MPTLVIHGTEDVTVPIDARGLAVAEAVESATLIEYEGEPHAVFATQTERLGDDLVEFLGKNDASAAMQEGGTIETAA